MTTPTNASRRAASWATIRERHALYVLSRAERAGSAPPSEAERWLATLEREHADIRAALNWADQNLAVDVLLRLTAALGAFWRAHCHFSEGRRWLDRALSLSAGQRTETRVDLLNAAGFLSRARGDYDTAEAQYREALSIREELGAPNKVAGSQRFMGNVAYDRGDLDEAERWWRLSLETLADTGDESRRMSVLNNLGIVAHHRGDDEAAIALYDQTFEYAQRLGASEHKARAQMNKAMALSVLDRLDEAKESARAAVVIYAGLDDTWDLVDAIDVLAGAIGRAGDAATAGWLFGGASGLRSALDVRRPASEQADYDLAVDWSRKHDPDVFDAAFDEGAMATLSSIIERATGRGGCVVILTPDQRLRIFVSSTLVELGPERVAVRKVIESMRLAPVMFEMGARPHPPRALYRAYLEQSHVFVGIYGDSYGWVAPTMDISGLEDEYRLSGDRPKLAYVKDPAPDRDARLTALLEDIALDPRVTLRLFGSPDELASIVADDLAHLLADAFAPLTPRGDGAADGPAEPPPPPVTWTLPTPPTDLVGRVAELDDVTRPAPATRRPARDDHRDGRHRQVAPRAGGGATVRGPLPGWRRRRRARRGSRVRAGAHQHRR